MVNKKLQKEEEIFEDSLLNQGVNTNDPAQNIGDSQASAILNIKMFEKGGIASGKGKTKVYDTVGNIGAYLTNRGGVRWNDNGTRWAVVAQDNGSETVIFAISLPGGAITQLPETGSTNSLTTGTLIHFAPGEDNLYWIVDGESTIYIWDGNTSNAVTTMSAASGSIPNTMRNIFFWNGSLGVANYDTNVSAMTRTAYRDYDWWNTVVRNTSGNKAFELIPEARQDEKITAVVGNAFNTLVMLRERSIFALQGSNETVWESIPITVTKGCIGRRTALVGNESLWYLSDLGIQQASGAQEVTDSNRFDSIDVSDITASVQSTFDAYTSAQQIASFATFYKNTYRLNIGSDVWIFDLLANERRGALTKGGVENDINVYINDDTVLYGMGSTDGFLYKLENGNSDADSDYTKSYATKDNDLGTPRVVKNLNEIRVFGKTEGTYPILVDYFLDGSATKTATLQLFFQESTSASSYSVDTGTSTAVGIGTLTDSTKTWTVNAFAGLILVDKDYNSFTVASNTATVLTFTDSSTPTAGNYAIGHNTQMFYTATTSTTEDWASFYGIVTTKFNTGNRPYKRANSIKLKFYTEGKNEPFEIYKYQIVYELTRHTSFSSKN